MSSIPPFWIKAPLIRSKILNFKYGQVVYETDREKREKWKPQVPMTSLGWEKYTNVCFLHTMLKRAVLTLLLDFSQSREVTETWGYAKFKKIWLILHVLRGQNEGFSICGMFNGNFCKPQFIWRLCLFKHYYLKIAFLNSIGTYQRLYLPPGFDVHVGYKSVDFQSPMKMSMLTFFCRGQYLINFCPSGKKKQVN